MAMVASSKEERVRFRYDPSMSRRTRRPLLIPDNTDTYSQVQDDLPSPLNSSMGEEEEEEKDRVMNPDIDKDEQNTTMKELFVSDQNNEEAKTLDIRTEPQVEVKEKEEEEEKEIKEKEKEKESSTYALVIVPKHGSAYGKDKNSGMLKRYIKVLDYMLKANRGSKKKLFASK